ncbi:MAG: CGGC domain-containing protein [Bacillota bacterium]
MKKIGIINCYNVSKKCSGSGCLKSFNHRTGSFNRYDEEKMELISFVHCNGCSEEAIQQVLERVKRMRAKGVDTVHLSTCIKAKCPWYYDFIDVLADHVDVVGYTHGKKQKGE